MKPDAQDRRELRSAWVLGVLVTAAMVGLVARVAYLQLRPPAPLAELLDTQRTSWDLQGRRGTLLDRRGRVIALTRPATVLFVDPYLVVDPNTFSERIGYALGYDPAALEMAMARRPRSRYVVIDARLDDQRLARLETFTPPPGLATGTTLVRDYPHGPLAGQLVGVVGTDGQGLEGLERMFDSRLRGRGGQLAFLRDAVRRPIWIDGVSSRAPVDGASVRLSLDVTIQSIAQAELARTCQEYRAQSGQLVVMEPVTGQILAMANYPMFDPNELGGSSLKLRRNRCVTDVFEPGSIFKPFVWAAATEWGLARPEEQLDCTTSGRYVTPKGRRLHDAHPQGVLTWDQVLIQSSNIGMAQVALRMEPKDLHTVVRAFGFDRPTGSGLPGEIGGLVTPLGQWTHYTLTSVPMGQEIAVTPLQVVRAFCVLANGGYLVTPTILADRSPLDPESVAIHHRVLSEEIAQYCKHILGKVMTEGTGRRARSTLYSMFGKTGTAQIPDRVHGGYHREEVIASFVCGAPLEDPRLVVGCFIHRPDRSLGHFGGTVAAPAARRVVEQVLQYQGVPTAVAEESLQAVDGGWWPGNTD